MNTFKHIWLIVLITICCFQSGKSQCSLFPFFTNYYDCVTNQSSTSFTINGATAPYTCTFVSTANNATVAVGSTIGNTGTVTSMPVGNFSIFITSANNCTVLTYFQVTVPFSASNVVFTNSASCFGANTGASSAGINTSFFTAPYTYSWTTGSTSQIATGLSPNTVYSVTITDSKGCKATNSVSVIQSPQINSTFTNTFITCFGASINSNITSTGGVAPFTYSVNGLAVSGNTATGLFAGTHTLITKDANACLQTDAVVITQVSQPVISFGITRPTCPGKSDGAVSATVSSAPPAYSYTWQPGLSHASSISNIPVGNYTLTVKDGSACITKSVAIVLPAASMSLTANTSAENCSAVDGAATINVTGGNFPYSYTTQPIIGAHISNTISLLNSGSYTTVVLDANNCIDTLVFNVGNLSTVSLSIVNFTPVSCYNQCTGSIQLSVQNGVQPITYSISGTATTTSSFITNICSGFYNVKAIDGIGCPATTTINFVSPPVFSYSASAPGSVCFGKSVLLQASAFGGAGGFNYVWNPGSLNSPTVSTTPSATTVYSLNVYDANGCTLAPYQLTVNINAPISININTSNAGICPGSTAQITPTVTGGDGNYTYLWQPGNINTSSIFVESVTIPSYTLSVNDGCGSPIASQVVPINLFSVTKPLFQTNDTVGCQPLCLSFTNLTPKSTNVIWNYGDKPFELPGNTSNYCYEKAGIYNIKITLNDSNNCKTSFTYTNFITVLASAKADFKTSPEIVTLDNSENLLIEDISVNGNTYNWNINGLYAGQTKNINYTFLDTGCNYVRLIVKSSGNCIDTTEKFICVIEGFNFYMPNCISVNHDNLNDVLKPLGTGWSKENYLFEVYNRWGIRLFKTDDYLEGWDGKTETGIVNTNDVYYWRINITDNINVVHQIKGYVSLLR